VEGWTTTSRMCAGGGGGDVEGTYIFEDGIGDNTEAGIIGGCGFSIPPLLGAAVGLYGVIFAFVFGVVLFGLYSDILRIPDSSWP